MKIAGRKNDGAWFRANKEITGYTDEAVKDALKAAIAGSAFIDGFRLKMQGIALEIGQDINAFSDNEALAQVYVDAGIPRQVWQGKLSYTIYDKVVEGVGEDAVTTYVPRGQSELHYFAKDLRKIVTKFIFATRATHDIANLGLLGEGNPGGLPNANKLE